MAKVWVLTTQPILGSFDKSYDLVGPDTMLYEYQKSRFMKDWGRADEIRDKANKKGWELSYMGDRYEVHKKKTFNFGLWG